MRKLLSLTALFLLVAWGEATAQTKRPWIAVSGSFNTYAMTDVNDGIASLNELFAPASMDELDSGFGFGASAGIDFASLTASVAYERLPAHSASETIGVEYDLAADAVVGRVAFRMPAKGRVQPSAGIGAGVAFVSGEWGTLDNPSLAAAPHPAVQAARQAVIFGPRVDVSGSGLYLEGFAQADVRLGSRWAIVPTIGYRQAKIEGKQVGSEGEGDGTFDFSGLATRLAVKFLLN